MDRLDLLFCNCDEASALTNKTIETEEDLLSAGEHLVSMGAKVVMISTGSKGAYLFETGSHQHFEAKSVEVVDVTGAGDALIAGTLHGISRGLDINRSLQLGLATAAFTLKKQGATTEDLRELSLSVIGNS
ncbi:PfkB family carbohydrate kinase [Kiloniella sp.]|uniref:PfkB family carbohydrate kinase n=1 Tax=Kiloniella sp. TaxID=1938587 RepID=UPI003B0154C9